MKLICEKIKSNELETGNLMGKTKQEKSNYSRFEDTWYLVFFFEENLVGKPHLKTILPKNKNVVTTKIS